MSYMSYLQPLKILELSHLSCCRYILPRRTTMLSRRKQKDSCRQPCGFSTLKIVKTTHGGSNASSLPWSDLPSQQNARDESIDKIQYVSLSPYPPFSFVHFFSIFSIPWRTWWRRFKLLNTCPRSQCGRYRGSDSREKTQGLVGFWEIKRWDSIWMYLVASRIYIYIQHPNSTVFLGSGFEAKNLILQSSQGKLLSQVCFGGLPFTPPRYEWKFRVPKFRIMYTLVNSHSL